VRIGTDRQPAGEGRFPAAIQWLLATACGLVVANLYYAQPLNGLISAALGMPVTSSGLIVTLPLIGYGVGLLTIVPLADLIENRALVLLLVGLETLCVLSINLTAQPVSFLGVAFFIGLTASAVQILVPYVTYLAPPAVSGKAVGKLVSGIMLGIMLARPVSSAVAHLWSWRAIFNLSGVLMAALFVTLWFALPPRRPTPGLSYLALLRSLGRIFVTTALLRRRALYHASMFGAFTAFWTAAPLWLTGPQFNLTQRGVAWVALAGVAGAIAPPFAGRIVDKGLSQQGTVVAMALVIGAFALSDLARSGTPLALGLVVASAVLLDFAVTANLVFGQRAIYSLAPEQRSRLNGLYLATFFSGGAISSALSGWCYSRFGWTGVSGLGAALPTLGLLYLATERKRVPD
jgi:predicted MFS family arabinose efflux permease